MTYTVFTGTPVVTVTDNRGLTVRTLDWNRTLPEQPLTLLVTRLTVADHALSGSAADPRLFRQGKTNLITFSTLAGQTARREHTDSGQHVAVFNAAGSPVWSRDPAGTVTLQRYDPLGRPESIRQQSGSVTRTSAGFVYGDNDPHTLTPQEHNLRGQCIRRYDEGGLLTTESVALCGVPLATSQQFFTDAAARPDWPQPFPLSSDLLESRSWATTLRADALGRIICQTDAAGHRRLPGYDVSGRQTQQAVQLAGQPAPKPLLASVTWSAAGQVLTEASGNGVTTTYRYEPQTQRLQGIVARREHDGVVLQDLNYHYDRVGNVTSVIDNTTLPSWFCNQTTTGERRFGYDALSQLISATGREDATNGAQNSGLPSPKGMGAGEGRCVNYTRSYAYDDSGNLSSLQHLGAVSHTAGMVTDVASNRTVCRENGSQTPDDVAWDNWFTPAGQLRTLQNGGSSSPLQWDPSGWLHTVILIERSATEVTQNDREVYQYRAGMRVRKQTRRLVNSTTGVWRVDDVKYLDGLEIRDSWQETAGSSAAPTYREQLEVVTTQAGRQAIRILHWIMGQPAGLGNDQLRFSVDDNIGSASLELDEQGQVIGKEEYFPYGGTAVWSARSNVEADYKVIRYSGKERDGTGLYYYGYRYYAPWLCRWTAADPGFEIDGLNLFRMVRNNPLTLRDNNGCAPSSAQKAYDHMVSEGEAWHELPKEDGIAAIRNLSQQNLSLLKAQPLTRPEANFIQYFQKQPVTLTHFTNSDFRENGNLRLRSRINLQKRGVKFSQSNTVQLDLDSFATDSFVFFSVSLGEKSTKTRSRFGNISYSVPLDKIKKKSRDYAHIELTDLAQNDQRPTTKRPEWLERSDNDTFFHSSVENNKITDLIFFGDDMMEGMAYRIVSDLRCFSEKTRDRVLAMRDTKDVDSVMNSLYRPQILFPNSVKIKAADLHFENMALAEQQGASTSAAKQYWI
ncbi:RHS repeat domain-containing protein [Nissabacter sp. SGAir0207]|uniref:RHS repeat domain-containing protein n=1 Tax=Nissabacter sp. SGAir0207 TaxID=2126321 RepID=UPI0010CD5604|nr:RHS repeat-associated core domain-containing protein [Nissabacter sp. SGAir0207]QCR35051.1 RHS repeat protein [Nissabacter sp. SGAir0207]